LIAAARDPTCDGAHQNECLGAYARELGWIAWYAVEKGMFVWLGKSMFEQSVGYYPFQIPIFAVIDFLWDGGYLD
jgi:hypothetical protein